MIVLAHGALGWWDELIFISVILIFLGMTIMSWVRGRQIPAEFEGDIPYEEAPDTPPGQHIPERFKLD